MVHRFVVIASFALGLTALASAGQQPPPTFSSGTEVVVLDVVATDGKGRATPDLRGEEVRVLEDGKACQVLSLRRVRAPAAPGSGAAPTERPPGSPAAQATPAVPATAADTPVRPGLVVLMFDRLTTASAPLARKGALDLLADGGFPADTWFAVLKVGYGVRLLASLTTDRAALGRAVEAATTGDADKSAAPTTAAIPAFVPPTPQTPAGVPPREPSSAAVAEVTKQLASYEWGQFNGGGQGLDSLYAVLGVARALRDVAGRKAIVYFAEGWQLPIETYPQVSQAYDEAISEANRANVAVHTVDARGLTSHKPMGQTGIDSVLDAFTADNRGGPGGGAYTPCDGGGGSGGKSCGQTGGFTPQELPGTLRDRLQGPNTTRLADDTGGLAIASTNDLGGGLSRVVQELREYYEIVYAPANPVLDGRFRKVKVEVARPGVRVRTRAGYFATPRRTASVAADELPLLDALAAKEPAQDFALRSRVLHFGRSGGERECVVLAELPLSEVQLTTDGALGVYRAHVSLLGYVKDEGGGVVARLSRDWPIEGPLAEREHAQSQPALFRQTLSLAPGRYRLELAVQDRNGGGKAVARVPFEVPEAAAGLGLASPVVVARASRATEGTGDPLRLGAVSFVPSLGGPLVPGAGQELALLLSAYPAPQTDPVTLRVELRKDERVVADGTPELAPADASGRATWLGGIPAAALPAGTYELVVRATQGTATREERATLELAARPPALPESPAVVSAPVDPALASDPALAPVLERAGRYVTSYQESFRNIVAEEAYTQRAQFPGKTQVWVDRDGKSRTSELRQERKTRADLVFVHLAGDVPWGLFRDVFELNGQKVRDRDERLARLFQQPSRSALQQANRILEESARYNIGGAARTTNVPTLPLAFLLPRNQHRFSFHAGEKRRIAGFEGLEIHFEETARPTIVKDLHGGDLPARGRFVIDTSRGAVMRSEVVFRFEPRRAEGSIETEYKPEPRLGIWLPSVMKEDYEDLPGTQRPLFNGPLRTQARYANFRQFTVSTEEKAALPPDAAQP